MRNIAKSVEKEERKRERLAISLKFFMPVTSSDSLNFLLAFSAKWILQSNQIYSLFTYMSLLLILHSHTLCHSYTLLF